MATAKLIPVRRLSTHIALQKWHKVEVGISRAAEGKVGKFFVGDMSDERALQLASKVVSEGFVFGVSQPLCVPGARLLIVFPSC